MATKAKWTFAVYMAGDNNLSDAGERDLKEMRRVGSKPEVNVVVEFDRSGPNHETKRYHIQKAGKNERIESLGETDCGDSKALINFIRWIAKEFPADHYALVLWNHGGGWEPTEMDRIAKKARTINYGKAEGSERSHSLLGRAFFRSTITEVLHLPTVHERAICSDDGSGHSLDTVELGNVLVDATAAIKQPVDVLGMDACLMSNLEVVYQAKPYVSIAVASEESEPNDGWPYDKILQSLVNNPDMTPSELGCLIVKAYTKYYANKPATWPVTQTALDVSKLEPLMKPLDSLANILIKNMATAKAGINKAQYDSKPFYHGTLFDTDDFCSELSKNINKTDIQQEVQAVHQALKPGKGHLILAESYHGKALKDCAGLSIYLPERRYGAHISEYYKDLQFARDHRWLAMLKKFHA